MYAVVEIGGHQYKVAEGDVIYVDKQNEESGEKLTFDRVMLVSDGNGSVSVGQPVVSGATVSAELLDNVQADKVIVFKKKRRKGYQKKNGHRQPMSRIEIKGIDTSDSGGTKKSSKKEKAKAAPEKEATKKSAPKKKETKKAAPKKESSKESSKKKSSKKESAKKESSKKESKASAEKEQGKVSTDMSASDAIDHIQNTPVDKLEGFVPDSEDRVTVTRAWESKQED